MTKTIEKAVLVAALHVERDRLIESVVPKAVGLIVSEVEAAVERISMMEEGA